MRTTLAGHLPLQDLIADTIDGARRKIAAAEGEEKKEEKKAKPAFKPNDGKNEEKDEKEAEKEKLSNVVDIANPDDMEKLAAACDFVAEKLAADSIENGGESKQGGQQLATGGPVGGKQVYKKDGSKSHNVPTSTPGEKVPENGPVASATQTNDTKAPPSAPYPEKGPFKTATIHDLIEKSAGFATSAAELAGKATRLAAAHPHAAATAAGAAGGAVVGGVAGGPGNRAAGAAKGAVVGGALGAGASHGAAQGAKHLATNPEAAAAFKAGALPKAASAKTGNADVDYLLQKISEYHGGGETLDSPSGEGPKPPTGESNSARSGIASNEAPKNFTKRDAKAPQKKQMAQVLTEPMQSAAHDSKVNENLRNAAKGGVKIAAARTLLTKIAEEGCKCDGKGECQYCKMKAALANKKAS